MLANKDEELKGIQARYMYKCHNKKLSNLFFQSLFYYESFFVRLVLRGKERVAVECIRDGLVK